MDVLLLDYCRSSSVPASPDDPPPADARGRRAWIAALTTLVGYGGGTGGTIATRRNGLMAYTGASIVLGLGLLAWTSLLNTLWAPIDPGLAPGTVLGGPNGGLLLWLLFGLLGSLRVLRAPGGGLLTFHMPFIGAALVLGGPTAGAWVAFLSSIERRELESQPWYGILANHSVLVIAAVTGGLTTQVLAGLLGASGAGGAALVAALAGITVLAAVSTVMGACTLVLRDHLGRRDLVGILAGQVGRVTIVEIALAALLALGYIDVGWWTPLFIGGLVLLLWDNNPPAPDDDLTGLRSAKGFARQLERGLGLVRRGVTAGATLLYLDLDGFGNVNNRFGHEVGDEVLREVGRRLRNEARRPDDIAARLGGDELAMFLPGLVDTDTARRRAQEIAAAITAPIASSVGPLTVGVSVGVRVLVAQGFLESRASVLRQADQAMYVAKQAGGGVHLYDATEPPLF